MSDPERLSGRLVDACIGILVGAAALYFAVWLLKLIWVWLAGAAVLASLLWLCIWWRSRW
ncbi:MAG: hypothetical protein Q7T56_19655 [Nocardioidaceae bacterium]|nr:hypothetical protein [Nocardioidaceae bacterium]